MQETRGSRPTAAQALIAYAMAEATTKAEAKEDVEGLKVTDWMVIIAVMNVMVTTIIFAGTKVWKLTKSLVRGADRATEKGKEIENLRKQVEEISCENGELNYMDGEKSYAELDSICTR